MEISTLEIDLMTEDFTNGERKIFFPNEDLRNAYIEVMKQQGLSESISDDLIPMSYLKFFDAYRRIGGQYGLVSLGKDNQVHVG